jgi:hypothetical protein
MEITVFRTVSQQEMSLREIKLMSDFYLTTDIEKYRDTLESICKDYNTSELLVSTKNYTGLNFWVNNGYAEITCVIPPEEQGTVSTELNLRRHIQRQ